mmetsp:Transcript_18234/g.42472  ORF Transcript_18234/g.42472 Transcript_18234/m.42472 type:complete len:791 (-) Transcript_18234:28-2400(-)
MSNRTNKGTVCSQDSKSSASGIFGNGAKKLSHTRATPLVVPAVEPVELFFFKRVFQHLCTKKYRRLAALAGAEDTEAERKGTRYDLENEEVPLIEFQRAMVRLFRVLHVFTDPEAFKASEYDVNENGSVGWLEFCSLWNAHAVVIQLSLAERVFLTLEDAERSMVGRFISVLVFIGIVISVGSFILSTLPEYQSIEGTCEPSDSECNVTTMQIFKDIDLVCVIFFCVEYGSRLILSAFVRMELLDREKRQLLQWMTSDAPMQTPNHLERLFFYFINPANLVDLAAILPWFLTQAAQGGGENNIVIRLIRLTRVVRAIRLGKHFEAVVIIARTLKKSLRALQVLTLNLVLGMIVFGSLMYFAEQGRWETSQQAYVRWEGLEWSEEDQRWLDVYNRSPFNSIPSCFWWAIVTASTVGYGDSHTPTTFSGKLVSVVSMLWSLCVLALPIGVVGNNFSQVWEEYDTERKEADIDRKQQEFMLKRSLIFGNPLHFCQQLRLEVWHDCGVVASERQREFLGEVDYILDLPPDTPVSQVREGIRLEPNFNKGQRRVSGTVSFEYNWTPCPVTSPDILLQGTLEVVVRGADDLLGIDWKESFSSDPFCSVVAHPYSPKAESDGITEPVEVRTKVLSDTSFPKWNEAFRFDMKWTRAGSETAMITAMRNSAVLKTSAQETETSTSTSRRKLVGKSVGSYEVARSTNELVTRVVPQLQREVAYLKRIRPQLVSEIAELRNDLSLILQTLRDREDVPPNKSEGPCVNGRGGCTDSRDAAQSCIRGVGSWAEPKQPDAKLPD